MPASKLGGFGVIFCLGEIVNEPASEDLIPE